MSWGFVERDGQRIRVAIHRDKRGTWISSKGQVNLIVNNTIESKTNDKQNAVEAPMTGKIVSIETNPGAQVTTGDVLVIMEAMKMEYRLKAPKDGQIKTIHCRETELVDLGTILVSFE